jgi:hypothetical protein
MDLIFDNLDARENSKIIGETSVINTSKRIKLLSRNNCKTL